MLDAGIAVPAFDMSSPPQYTAALVVEGKPVLEFAVHLAGAAIVRILLTLFGTVTPYPKSHPLYPTHRLSPVFATGTWLV